MQKQSTTALIKHGLKLFRGILVCDTWRKLVDDMVINQGSKISKGYYDNLRRKNAPLESRKICIDAYT
jgi:hypothetical protein